MYILVLVLYSFSMRSELPTLSISIRTEYGVLQGLPLIRLLDSLLRHMYVLRTKRLQYNGVPHREIHSMAFRYDYSVHHGGMYYEYCSLFATKWNPKCGLWVSMGQY